MSNWITKLIDNVDSIITLNKDNLIIFKIILKVIRSNKDNLVVCLCVFNREGSSLVAKSFNLIPDELSDSIKLIISKDTKCLAVLCVDFTTKSLNAENILSFNEFHVFHCFV